jgi:hypothetical protein
MIKENLRRAGFVALGVGGKGMRVIFFGLKRRLRKFRYLTLGSLSGNQMMNYCNSNVVLPFGWKPDV